MNPFLIFIFILCGTLAVFCLYFMFKPKTKEEKEYERKLKESLEDEFIIDPETGAKLTLEQAESGHWIEHNNELLTVPEEQIEKLYTEEQKEVERAINYLKSEPNYVKENFTEQDIDLLENTKILSKYDNWTYSDVFKIEYCDGYVFLPYVKIIGNQHSYFEDDYQESQVMFWIKLDNDFGHYYLREKSSAEKILDLIKNDDDLKLKGYESFTFKKSSDILNLLRVLKSFEGQEKLEIEFYKNNVFIKNEKFINYKDINRIEKIIKNIC